MKFNPNPQCISYYEILFTDTPVQQRLPKIMTKYSLNKSLHSHVSFSTNVDQYNSGLALCMLCLLHHTVL